MRARVHVRVPVPVRLWGWGAEVGCVCVRVLSTSGSGTCKRHVSHKVLHAAQKMIAAFRLLAPSLCSDVQALVLTRTHTHTHTYMHLRQIRAALDPGKTWHIVKHPTGSLDLLDVRALCW